jgi:hypothetical protein
VLQDQAGAGRQLVRGAARGGFKVGDLLRLAADRCSLEYHSSSVHTAASCCAAAYSPRRARALQVSSRSEEAAEIIVCSMWVTEAGRRTAHVQFVPHT